MFRRDLEEGTRDTGKQRCYDLLLYRHVYGGHRLTALRLDQWAYRL